MLLWEVSIKIDCKESGCEDVDWIHLLKNELLREFYQLKLFQLITGR
jgi:hypothetical protein